MILRRLLSQRGLSLVEITIAAGALGLLSLGVMRMMGDSSKTEKSLRTKVGLTTTKANLTKYFTNPMNCQHFLSQLNGRVMPIGSEYNLNSGANGPLKITQRSTNKDIIKKDQKFGQEYEVSNIGMRVSNITAITSEPPFTHEADVEFYLNFRYCKKGGLNCAPKGNVVYTPGQVPPSPYITEEFKQSIRVKMIKNGSNFGATFSCDAPDNDLVNAAVSEAQKKMCAFEKKIIKLAGGKTENCDPAEENKFLHGDVHHEEGCRKQGGTPTMAGSAYVCKFNMSGCPSGWTPYGNWGSTVGAAQQCGKDRNGGSCGPGRCASIAATNWKDEYIEKREYCDDKASISVNGCAGNCGKWVYNGGFTARGCY